MLIAKEVTMYALDEQIPIGIALALPYGFGIGIGMFIHPQLGILGACIVTLLVLFLWLYNRKDKERQRDRVVFLSFSAILFFAMCAEVLFTRSANEWYVIGIGTGLLLLPWLWTPLGFPFFLTYAIMSIGPLSVFLYLHRWEDPLLFFAQSLSLAGGIAVEGVLIRSVLRSAAEARS
jgi:hypothetical protein